MKRFIFKHRQYLIYPFLTILLLMIAANPSFAQDEEEFTQDDLPQNSLTQNDPVKLFDLGQEAHEKGEFEIAVKYYTDALKANPKFPEAEFQMGNALQALGDIENAEKAFRRALTINPDWNLAMAGLGSLLVKKGEFAQAERLLTKATDSDSLNFPAYTALTELKIKTNASEPELKNLLTKIQSLTAKAKTPASVWVSRGALERKLGLFSAAKQSLDKALSIDPKNYSALTEKIEIAISESDFESAVAQSRSFVQVAPKFETAKLLLARSYVLSGNSKAAIEILEKIDSPSNDAVLLKTSINSARSENIEDLEKLLSGDAENISFLAKLCNLSRAESPQKALEYCQKASSLEPDNINHAIGFGAALVQLQRYSDAVVLFRNLQKISPENYTIRANLATALFQMQDYKNAVNEYKWITEKQPELAIAYYFLAISHDKLEEYVAALANYQQFLRLADKEGQKLEIEKVDLRLPILQRQIKSGMGKKKGR